MPGLRLPVSTDWGLVLAVCPGHTSMSSPYICVDTGHGGSWRFGQPVSMYFWPMVCRTDLQFIQRKYIYYSWISQSAWPNTNVERTVLFNNYSLSELSNQLFISISVSSFSLSALFCGGRVVERRSVSDVWRCCTVLVPSCCRKSSLM